MAEIKGIAMQNSGIEVKLSISKDEYRILQHHTSDIVVLPSGKDSLTHDLTTGKLGNSNRIMLPKKLLESFKIQALDKKAPANIFMLAGDAFLLIRIKGSEIGIPKFAGD